MRAEGSGDVGNFTAGGGCWEARFCCMTWRWVSEE